MRLSEFFDLVHIPQVENVMLLLTRVDGNYEKISL